MNPVFGCWGSAQVMNHKYLYSDLLPLITSIRHRIWDEMDRVLSKAPEIIICFYSSQDKVVEMRKIWSRKPKEESWIVSTVSPLIPQAEKGAIDGEENSLVPLSKSSTLLLFLRSLWLSGWICRSLLQKVIFSSEGRMMRLGRNAEKRNS